MKKNGAITIGNCDYKGPKIEFQMGDTYKFNSENNTKYLWKLKKGYFHSDNTDVTYPEVRKITPICALMIITHRCLPNLFVGELYAAQWSCE